MGSELSRFRPPFQVDTGEWGCMLPGHVGDGGTRHKSTTWASRHSI